jgi:hypothetical protein
VIAFESEPAAVFKAGLRGNWRRHFPALTAPIGPGLVAAAFFGLAPDLVGRALPNIWTRIVPAAALKAGSPAWQSDLPGCADT